MPHINTFDRLSIVDESSIKTVRLNKYLVNSNVIVSAEMLRGLADRHMDKTVQFGTVSIDQQVLDQLVFRLSTFLLQSQHTKKQLLSVDIPATWWDHLKQDLGHSPKAWKRWLAARLPAPKMRTVTETVDAVVRVCPHNNSYFPEGAEHIDFLSWGDTTF